LTPQGSESLIDEVLVGFKKSTKAEEAREIILKAGCIIKDAPLDLGETTVYTVDIPDDKNVEEMVKVFSKKKGVDYAEPNGISTIDTDNTKK
jgi:hypothetical protein